MVEAKQNDMDVDDPSCEEKIRNRAKTRRELSAMHLIDHIKAFEEAVKRSENDDVFSSACSSSWRT